MRVEQLYHRRRQLSDKCQRCVGKEFRAGGDADWFSDLSRLSFLALGAHPQCRISAPRSSPLSLQNPGISRTNQGKAGCATSSHYQPRIGNQQWHIHLQHFTIPSALGLRSKDHDQQPPSTVEDNAKSTSHYSHVIATICAIDISLHVLGRGYKKYRGFV
jgi:hypothetical protein